MTNNIDNPNLDLIQKLEELKKQAYKRVESLKLEECLRKIIFAREKPDRDDYLLVYHNSFLLLHQRITYYTVRKNKNYILEIKAEGDLGKSTIFVIENNRVVLRLNFKSNLGNHEKISCFKEGDWIEFILDEANKISASFEYSETEIERKKLLSKIEQFTPSSGIIEIASALGSPVQDPNENLEISNEQTKDLKQEKLNNTDETIAIEALNTSISLKRSAIATESRKRTKTDKKIIARWESEIESLERAIEYLRENRR